MPAAYKVVRGALLQCHVTQHCHLAPACAKSPILCLGLHGCIELNADSGVTPLARASAAFSYTALHTSMGCRPGAMLLGRTSACHSRKESAGCFVLQ